MLRRSCLSLLSLSLSLFSLGCASLNMQKPTAAVAGMNVIGVDANGFTMNFDVDVKNPNSVAIPLTAADYKLDLAGTNIAQGKAKPQGEIPAGGSKRLAIPVTLTYENVLSAEQGIVKSGGNVPYALAGGLSLNTGVPLLGDVRVPLNYTGTLPLRDVLNNPQALMQNPAAQKLAKELIGSVLTR
jgi:LEA14-like dessication related protein